MKKLAIDWDLIEFCASTGMGCLVAVLPVFTATLIFVWIILRLFA